MALGEITPGAQSGEKPGAPTFVDVLAAPGDDDYPTGGTTGFQALVRAALGRDVTVLGVIGQACGDNVPVYDPANDTLQVFVRSTGAEVANNADLSGVTFNLIVLSK